MKVTVLQKSIILFALLFSCKISNAQNIGINATGATPNSSAMLDVNASDRGMLVPRVNLVSITDATTISNPATSLLVWNSNASITGGVGVGYYYNAGTPLAPDWVRLINNTELVASSGWSTAGNAGTNSEANFLGTTDNTSLTIRTNNTEKMRIDSLGRVGIGTNQPNAKLHIDDGSVLFAANGITLPLTPGLPPASDAGRRTFWYPDKAAFRTGSVSGTHWNRDSIGIYSFASGSDTRALGTYSTAMGNNTYARGNYSNAIGLNATSNAGFSTAIGNNNFSNGLFSTSIGYDTYSNGYYSTAIGASAVANGENAISIGYYTTTNSYGGVSIGVLNDDTDIPDPSMTSPSDRLFQLGNGDPNTSSRSNAVTVLMNGNTGIGTMEPGTKMDLDGALTVRHQPTSLSVTSASMNINPSSLNRTYLRINSNNTPANRQLTIADGTVAGQMLIIQCIATGSNGFRITDGGNINIAVATSNLTSNDTLSLIWDGTAWIQTAFSDN